jgi:acetylornithine deacetylase/succinyl-diaminopimelate desuccinylase-like protein
MDALTGEVIELLQQLIRNACVNDGSVGSGGEARSAEVLEGYLEGSGLDVETFEPQPGRVSLVARREKRRPDAPTVALMGHTDVVPANPAGWTRDPFGGELVDGEVWGRGAVDMLNLTASMAVAVRRIAKEDLDGGLVYIAVADEEALGHHGAGWLVDNAREAVTADYVITESGGISLDTPEGTRLPVMVGEKGSCWCVLRISGTPGHASQPLRTDNALVKAAEVVRRLAEYRPEAHIHEIWHNLVEGLALPTDLAADLVDPARIMQVCEEFPDLALARQAHACTHTTFAPTVMRAGTKTNVIPDTVELEVDIRTLPGQSGEDVREMLDDILDELGADVEVVAQSDDPSSTSPVDTPLWTSLQRVSSGLRPGTSLIPFLTVGATDARFFRRLGVPAYGYGLFSSFMSFGQFNAMFHGDDERVDVESLRLSTELWQGLATDFLI